MAFTAIIGVAIAAVACQEPSTIPAQVEALKAQVTESQQENRALRDEIARLGENLNAVATENFVYMADFDHRLERLDGIDYAAQKVVMALCAVDRRRDSNDAWLYAQLSLLGWRVSALN